MKRVKIFAHRGASAYAPENTLEAFQLAMNQGADGIELDVQLTKDGELVVIHDETIDRVSDGKGAVRDYTLEELKKISVSNHFEQYPDVKIPTLREVLELVKPGTMEINIELKTGIFWYPEIERKVLELVKEEGMEDRIIYSSFNHYSVQKIKELSPEAETAYLIGDVMLDVAAYTKNTGIKGLHPALFHVKMADFLKEYKESGIALRVWTVNEKDQIRWLIDEGVDAVITNYPDRGLEARVEAEAESREC
ncbi:MAG TPA: glycerophosphodiester phosphodiesterase [Candidatus Fusicatenibacter merdavium]|uniref:Glycerophosphodiester phosphodiesterase n=1 Tax=Candidatus Fusicatenibacter merdavium TaxID=2838600 RepID=A0A9D1XC08_9FIRM|nr:glycerophosphodiester phosphodiesterase [Candidatus Fusicatenibacter merdavium]